VVIAGTGAVAFMFRLRNWAAPPRIGPPLMRDSCKITTGGDISENKKVFGGAGISDSPGGRFWPVTEANQSVEKAGSLSLWEVPKLRAPQ